ncbi:site-specific DNA-methyltransferase [Flagellimonas iocasae]|uniref:site-specific DNA-methyltransferase (adenine-specific) n=1 Tax=Flagellimonas iocasae TaxID=2055905 RepID=A0ABW4Y1A2_9FLAO
MAKKRKASKSISSYEHKDKERLNNPPVGLVNENTDSEYGQNIKKYAYDPHLDPQLHWAGKTERISFEVPTVSLHVHERIDPKSIIDSVKKPTEDDEQLSLFEQNEKPLREAVEFYKHKEGWTNRLISGDSLLVMNSLLEKEGMAGKVQMVYFDPPYGIKYGSNFQPFTNKRDVKDGRDEDLTQEPETIKAFRDTWELGIHSYLTHLRDRILLAKELLSETGSIFVQISDQNIHRVRMLLDEVFGSEGFVSSIYFQTTSGFATKGLSRVGDQILWYVKDQEKFKFNQLFEDQELEVGIKGYNWAQFPDGKNRGLTKEEKQNPEKLPSGTKIYKAGNIKSQGKTNSPQDFLFEGKNYHPGSNHHWKTTVKGLENLAKKNRIHVAKNSIQYIRFIDDFPYKKITNVWLDTGTGSFLDDKKFVVQTSPKVLEKCILMTSDPGDLILDITAGSGTTAYASENYGRRWITCDTSRVAITIAKQRLITANYNFYELLFPDLGIGGGFKYKTVPHITLKSIANNEPSAEEALFDQPIIDTKKSRITGPFTVESIPAPIVRDLEGNTPDAEIVDASISRQGETLRQDQWKDELLRTGVRAKGGRAIEFSRLETLSGTKYIQVEGETKAEENNPPQKVLVVFGPEHAPLEQRLVELAINEARLIKPDVLLFCSFQFDEEAAKDIDETPEKLVGFKLLKAQMNMDLQTEDLKKNKNTNQSFWLIGSPDIQLKKLENGKVQVEVFGFDYYNPKTGEVDSGGKKNIAMWLLDPDYDGRSLFPKQVFFPMAGAIDGWTKLAKNLKAEIDQEKIGEFRGTKSLPFSPGKQIAVKLIDDRGIESLKILHV